MELPRANEVDIEENQSTTLMDQAVLTRNYENDVSTENMNPPSYSIYPKESNVNRNEN